MTFISNTFRIHFEQSEGLLRSLLRCVPEPVTALGARPFRGKKSRRVGPAFEISRRLDLCRRRFAQPEQLAHIPIRDARMIVQVLAHHLRIPDRVQSPRSCVGSLAEQFPRDAFREMEGR